ncbi:unnamed protein product [Pleuronectes platessa]|uniref:Uncharacterized protein n=1 Tax=Pleuronectes platessa TaxID=8262 RepID=A0A9N7UGX9_PLEPL|nr:unnamed protein product [Pleuronectes platessa]
MLKTGYPRSTRLMMKSRTLSRHRRRITVEARSFRRQTADPPLDGSWMPALQAVANGKDRRPPEAEQGPTLKTGSPQRQRRGMKVQTSPIVAKFQLCIDQGARKGWKLCGADGHGESAPPTRSGRLPGKSQGGLLNV